MITTIGGRTTGIEIMERPSRNHEWEPWISHGSRYTEFTCAQCHAALRFGRKGLEDEGIISDPNNPYIHDDCPDPCRRPPHCLGCYLRGDPVECDETCDHETSAVPFE